MCHKNFANVKKWTFSVQKYLQKYDFFEFNTVNFDIIKRKQCIVKQKFKEIS
jgi:hypothetical protein